MGQGGGGVVVLCRSLGSPCIELCDCMVETTRYMFMVVLTWDGRLSRKPLICV